ncbi:probable LRR receptor-like serine/threonine-protein kinase At1g07650 [Rhododendron vialii]|uniref:probable LRR receptor-like serine/threonine-protein kinase At1g07650 n=1 Tax=Rhododendron vialii TaxID=182163 RepID=UPI002660343C|nr:probable LRR receptor-like serine/threonine-protein kinase At1g07650 [Rhododendron vialii]
MVCLRMPLRFEYIPGRMVTVSEYPKAMRSVLLVMLFILLCSGAGETQGQTRRITDDEIAALGEIAEQLGKKDWNLSLNECDENGNWLPPVKYGLTYESKVNCNCLRDRCHISAINLRGQDLPGVLPKSIAKLPNLIYMWECFQLAKFT